MYKPQNATYGNNISDGFDYENLKKIINVDNRQQYEPGFNQIV